MSDKRVLLILDDKPPRQTASSASKRISPLSAKSAAPKTTGKTRPAARKK